MKRMIVCTAMLVIAALTACKNGQPNENAPKGYLSVADFSSDDIIVMGTYDELLSKMGEPKRSTDRFTMYRMNDSLINIPGMFYDGISYIRRGDSVQLAFVDIRKSGVKLTLQTGGGQPLTLDSNSLCDDFYAYMGKYVFLGNDFNSLPDEAKTSFESHYSTGDWVYTIGFVCDTIDKKHGLLIMPVYTLQDKRLWYIDFSPVDMGGLYRNN